ncbi:MAG: thioesterase family protein [Burkholderiales bacterium]
MKTDFKLVYMTTIPVRWGDMDSLAHVNNTVYFRYMEQSRVEWFALGSFNNHSLGNGPVLAHAECNFRKPVLYPSTVEVRLYCGMPGNTSLPLFQEIRVVGDEQTIYADGKSRVVWFDHQQGKTISVPEGLRKLVQEK